MRRGQTASRERVGAGVVVSNSDLLRTLEEMVGREHLAPGLLDAVRALRPTFPCFLTHLGLRGVPDEVLRQAQGYYWDSWEMDRVGLDALRFKIFAPTLYEPAMAPPGGQEIVVQKVQELDHGSIADWPAHKRAVEAFVLDRLERTIPGIGGRIVVCASASAHTSWRFTLNHRGAMLGWEMSPDQLGALRPDVTTPVDGLYLVGHWTRPGGGITPVIVSAERVARQILAGGRRALSGGEGEARRAARAIDRALGPGGGTPPRRETASAAAW